ncbi:MAG TPA: MucR family transcriptional regulator [Sphingomonas sp.]|uniref:MucR family transcriptional regulator n=1 Tax=Sphingomonas sp. TaxID=28214 RepID=UPI002EDB001E
MTRTNADTLIALTADIVAAHVAFNKVAVDAIAGLIADVYGALSHVDTPAAAPETPPEPAVPIRQSVKHDYIVCLEDGAKLKMLKRYLMSRYKLTPDQYRARWGLPADYPMVAPAYSDRRRSLAKEIGLGTRPARG